MFTHEQSSPEVCSSQGSSGGFRRADGEGEGEEEVFTFLFAFLGYSTKTSKYLELRINQLTRWTFQFVMFISP
jgi:hypothetical protein